jgi:hypothetical protein
VSARQFNIFLLILFVLAGCTPQPEYMRLPVLHDPRPKFILISWHTPSGIDAFALFSSDEQMYRFLDGFRATAPHITFAELEQRIERLPRKCLLTWMADPAHHIAPPSGALKRRVKAVAERRDIDLAFNAIITEDTGI